MNQSQTGLPTPATISDVAEAAGVSKTTVSHVLSGNRPVSDATRRKVLKVVEQLGFKQNYFAAGLTRGRSHTIALVVQDLTNPYYPTLARGLQQAVGGQGYVVLLGDLGAGVPSIDQFLSETVQRRVDGAVIAAVDIPESDLEPLRQAGIAVVTVGEPRRGTGTDVVSADDAQIARDAVAYLHGKGHRRIATISGPMEVAPGSSRLDGYRAGLREHGIDAAPGYETTGDWTRESGAKAMASLLILAERPTAVFCANDLMAIGAIDAAVSHGLDLPSDVAIVGVDDIDAASLVRPALTTVRVPAQEIGRVVGEQLLARINGGDGPQRRVLVQHTLIVRESA